jgi:hypothetical protein
MTKQSLKRKYVVIIIKSSKLFADFNCFAKHFY